MASRLFHAYVSLNAEGLATKEPQTFRPPQPSDDLWCAVCESDNRHYVSGNSLAESVNHYVKCVSGEAFDLAPFTYLYRLGGPAELEYAEGVYLEEVFTWFKSESVPASVATEWARVVADRLADPLSALGITVANGRLFPPDDQGFYFLFSWSEPLFKVARQVAARVSEVLLEAYIPAPMRGVYWERGEWAEGEGERAEGKGEWAAPQLPTLPRDLGHSCPSCVCLRAHGDAGVCRVPARREEVGEEPWARAVS